MTTSKLAELKALREKATGGTWKQGGCSGRMILMENVTDAFNGGDIADVDTKANSNFIVAAAKNWLTLIECLELAVKSLKFECGNRCAEQNPCFAKVTLKEIESKLGGL